MRECWTCKRLLDEKSFYKDGFDKDGNQKYRRRCIECDRKKRSLPIEKAKRENKRFRARQAKNLKQAAMMQAASKFKKKDPLKKLDKKLKRIGRKNNGK